MIIKQVKELRAICPDLTEEEALCALKLHKDRWGLSSFLIAHPQHLLSVLFTVGLRVLTVNASSQKPSLSSGRMRLLH